MAYSIIEQRTRDIDYFVRDREKNIHVTSAGGILPPTIAENDTINEALISERINLIPLFEVEINPNLNDILIFETQEARVNYLEDFRFMASCGFYSYDKSQLGIFEDTNYHLVAWPGQKINDGRNSSFLERVPQINNVVPVEFNSFNLFEFLR